jgi:hypothetical protein
MRNKLVKSVDEEVWRRFVAYCKIRDVTVGDELNDVLELHLKKNLKRLFGEK